MEYFILEQRFWDLFIEGPTEEIVGVQGEEKVAGIVDLNRARWKLLEDVLCMSSVSDNPRAQIVFEFVYSVVHYCSECKFSYSQMSAVLGVFGEVFSTCFVDFSSGKTRDDAIAIYTTLISRLAARSDDGASPALLDVDSVKGVTILFSDTIVKNFDAFTYVMKELPVEMAEEVLVVVDTPVLVQPLREGERLDPSAQPSVSALQDEEGGTM